jgi:hypothetical protein
MRPLPPYLHPAPPAPQKRPPAKSGDGRYVRSFLIERLIIGGLGVVLPFAVLFFDWGLFSGQPVPRDSISAYYYSGMHDWFVITMGTTGLFLIAYKITEGNLDNTLSILAGVFAIVIPFFPTARTPEEKLHGLPLTPLQNLLGERAVQSVHFVASGLFILSLGAISILFGRREGVRKRHGNRRTENFWRLFHFGCAGAIGLAGIWIVVTMKILDGPYWSLLAGETACALAWGASWFLKGYEIEYVLGRDGLGSGQAETSLN